MDPFKESLLDCYNGLKEGCEAAYTGSQLTLNSDELWKYSKRTLESGTILFFSQCVVIGAIMVPVWAIWNILAHLFPSHFFHRAYFDLSFTILYRFMFIIPVIIVLFFRYGSTKASETIFFGMFKKQGGSALDSIANKEVQWRLSVVYWWFRRVLVPKRLGVGLLFVIMYLTGFSSNETASFILDSLVVFYLSNVLLGDEFSVLILGLSLISGSSYYPWTLIRLATTSLALTTEFLTPYSSRLEPQNWTTKKNKKIKYMYVAFGLLFNGLLCIPLLSPYCWLLAQGAAATLLHKIDQEYHVLANPDKIPKSLDKAEPEVQD